MKRILMVVFLFVFAAASGWAGKATSADGTVSIRVPDDWVVVKPTEGVVVFFLTEKNRMATLTVLREDLGSNRGQIALRYLFMKLDNFEKTQRIENQSNPEPVLVAGKEAARASFEAEIKQPQGGRLRGGFIFTCLPVGGNLFTIVGTARADDIASWQPLLDLIAGSLAIGST